MNNILFLADNFLTSVSEDVPELQIKLAGRKNRKQLERDLSYAKDIYSKRRQALQGYEKSHADLSNAIDHHKKEIESRRKEIQRIYDALKQMDFDPSIREVKFMEDDVGYIRGKRLYRLDENQAFVPFKKKEPELEEEFDLTPEDSDEDVDVDELLATLVD